MEKYQNEDGSIVLERKEGTVVDELKIDGHTYTLYGQAPEILRANMPALVKVEPPDPLEELANQMVGVWRFWNMHGSTVAGPNERVLFTADEQTAVRGAVADALRHVRSTALATLEAEKATAAAEAVKETIARLKIIRNGNFLCDMIRNGGSER